MRARHWKLISHRLVSTIALVSLAAVIVLQTVGVRAATGPLPAANATILVTPTTGLTDGQSVSVTVNTTGGTALFAVTIHLCKPNLTGYGSSNFAYSGSSGVRCVYDDGVAGGNGITTGGITGADYESITQFGGTETTSGALPFHVGTGTVNWLNSGGFGPQTLTCDSVSPCDIVVRVDLTGLPATTYFIQQVTFGGAPVTTTTTAPPVTTTTAPPVTTTTTAPPVTTTTTAPPVTTTTTGAATTTTTGGTLDTGQVNAGGTFTVASSGWQAGSSVAVTLHSTPVSLGTLIADGAGHVQGAFSVPSNFDAGAHTVELAGSNAQGSPRSVSIPLTVVASSGGGLAFTGASTRDVASVGLLVLAIGMFILGEHLRRRSASS